MVDEDADTYTFRKQLNSTGELKIPREDILFMTRRNPTHLKGNPGSDYITLEWHAPYNEVESYKIYSREKGEKEFRHIISTGSLSQRIRGLKSNAIYEFQITAIDTGGEESLPCQPITIGTQNRIPHPPGNARLHKLPGGSEKTFNVRLTWDRASDPDGTVDYYNVYMKSDITVLLHGKTQRDEYLVNNLNSTITDSLVISSVDNNGAESVEVEVDLNGNVTVHQERSLSEQAYQRLTFFALSISASYVQPMGTFDELAGPGFGVTIGGTFHNLLLPGLEAGLELGYFFFSSSIEELHSLMMLPLYAVARYSVPVYRDFHIVPEAGFGYSFNMVNYYEYGDLGGLEETVTTKTAFEPVFTGGLAGRYDGFEDLSLSLGVRYYGVIENDGLMHILMIYAGAGYRL